MLLLVGDTYQIAAIQFDVEVPKVINESDTSFLDFQLLESFEEEEKALIRFMYTN